MSQLTQQTGPTLILSPRYTEDAQRLWQAAVQRGWQVERVHGWRVPDHLRRVHEPVLYLEALLAPTIAEAFGLSLVEPPDDWLPQLPEEYRRRAVHLTTWVLFRTGAGRWSRSTGLGAPVFMAVIRRKCLKCFDMPLSVLGS